MGPVILPRAGREPLPRLVAGNRARRQGMLMVLAYGPGFGGHPMPSNLASRRPATRYEAAKTSLRCPPASTMASIIANALLHLRREASLRTTSTAEILHCLPSLFAVLPAYAASLECHPRRLLLLIHQIDEASGGVPRMITFGKAPPSRRSTVHKNRGSCRGEMP
jgi:hypothetical protein